MCYSDVPKNLKYMRVCIGTRLINSYRYNTSKSIVELQNLTSTIDSSRYTDDCAINNKPQI